MPQWKPHRQRPQKNGSIAVTGYVKPAKEDKCPHREQIHIARRISPAIIPNRNIPKPCDASTVKTLTPIIATMPQLQGKPKNL